LIHIGFLTGYRNRLGAILEWSLAFTQDIRRERSYTIDDAPLIRAYAPAQADPRKTLP